jgi:para-nitrobenzyl esterase
VAGPAAASGLRDRPVVRTDKGVVRGLVRADSRLFAGIPYAASPAGALRWRPPQPVAPWSGIRDATRYASPCAQGEGLGGVHSESEDCLYLNVTTPRTGSHLPVLVWVHGGGFVNGAGSLYDGARLAVHGDVIVVTINYRLGVFGYLANRALDEGRGAGQYGLQDQRAALRWVQRNAAAFGGDPHRVTIAGESAGALSVCAQLASPAATGLFQKAIIQSGPCTAPFGFTSLTQAQTDGDAVATAVGCDQPATVAACMRGKSVDALLVARSVWWPAYGGAELPLAPGQAFARGLFHRVPILQGTNHDEDRLFVAAEYDGQGHPLTAEQYVSLVNQRYGPRAPEVLAHYPLTTYPSPSLALATLNTDASWACPALGTDRAAALRTPVYAYEFADENAPVLFPVPNFPMGAFHAAELQYLFPFGTALSEPQQRLSAQMVEYWTRFARTGQPSTAGMPQWPRFQPSSVRVLSLAPEPVGIHPVDLAAEHQCGFWATFL